MGNTNSSSEDTWCKVHSECKHYKLNLSHVGFDVDISKSICMDNQSTSNTSCMYPFCVAALSYHFECSRWVFPAFMPTSGAYGFNGSLLLFFFKLSWWIFLSTWMQLYVHVGNTVSVLCGWVHMCVHACSCMLWSFVCTRWLLADCLVFPSGTFFTTIVNSTLLSAV